MSIDSRYTIGAIASKKASALSSVRARMASASVGEVKGPVAMMTRCQSDGGKSATSPGANEIFGCLRSASVTAAENPSRSTASAPPAGT
jgi:hypothetical protein